MKHQLSREQRIPDKVYFRIGEVSSLVGVDPHVLRFWESAFTIIKPRRAKSNQRLYRKKDVENLLLIKSLLHGQGYTISGARRLFKKGTEDSLELKKPGKVTGKKPYRQLAEIKKELMGIQQLLATKSLRLKKEQDQVGT